MDIDESQSFGGDDCTIINVLHINIYIQYIKA